MAADGEADNGGDGVRDATRAMDRRAEAAGALRRELEGTCEHRLSTDVQRAVSGMGRKATGFEPVAADTHLL